MLGKSGPSTAHRQVEFKVRRESAAIFQVLHRGCNCAQAVTARPILEEIVPALRLRVRRVRNLHPRRRVRLVRRGSQLRDDVFQVALA